jgi:hypothetical protein
VFPSAYFPSHYFPSGYFPSGAPVTTTGGQHFPDYFGATAFPAEYFPGELAIIPPPTPTPSSPGGGYVRVPNLPPRKTRRPETILVIPEIVGSGWIELYGFDAHGFGSIEAVGSQGTGASLLLAVFLASGTGDATQAEMRAIGRAMLLGLALEGHGQQELPPVSRKTQHRVEPDDEDDLLQFYLSLMVPKD